ncbi:tripartite tricarboxylate transporter permease [Tianweitania sediminis]|uniref:Tripartite tricarboxylate transporter permease n=2 Tax=Tianweitania sediminis TaxID=1502156 RepID=A0A8J7UHE3_9HYPH|nr:tripartite tricarboxylate transporter permease [Tianweitania sediminis]MBP0437718.1 tripartite tricarboxylate transporter permease [Tianweitania sediminis]
MLDGLLQGFAVLLTFENLAFCLLGAFLGTIVGVLPGLGPTATIALLLPISLKMDVTGAIILLSGIYYGVAYGGTITSVLMRIPGEASSVVTCLDGYEMARKGRAGAALGIAAIGSFVAGTFGILGITLIAPLLAEVVLSFGPAEYAAMMFAGLCLIMFFAQSGVLKALLMAAIGLTLGTIGLDPISSTPRLTFGLTDLIDGIDIATLAIGLFGISELLMLARNRPDSGAVLTPPNRLFAFLPNREESRRSVMPIARGSVLGFLVGLLPGGGAVLASFLSYAIERKLSKHPEEFGRGAVEGLAGPEAANNSGTAGAFVPMLTLGIPSNAVTALLLGAFLIHGVVPGPLIMEQHPEVFWGVIASMYVGNVILVLLNVPLIGLFVRALDVPRAYLATMILMVCVIGVYSSNLAPFDIALTIAFGFVGYAFRRANYDLAPLILAFVLGPTFERSLRQLLLIEDGDLIGGLWNSPIALTLVTLGVVLLVSGLAGLGRSYSHED